MEIHEIFTSALLPAVHETFLHRIVLIASSNSEDEVSVSGIVIIFGCGGTVITEIDSFFSNVARYLLRDISDIFLDNPYDFQSFIDLNNIAIDLKYREQYHGEDSNRNNEFYKGECLGRYLFHKRYK